MQHWKLLRLPALLLFAAAFVWAEEQPYRNGPYSPAPLLQQLVKRVGAKGPLRFVVMSDSHLSRRFPQHLDFALSLKPDLIVHCGDRVNRGSGDISEWLRLEEQIAGAARSLPFIPLEGNHEGMGGASMRIGRGRFLQFFGLDKPYFFFDAANARFIVLSWEFQDDREQAGWLEQTLKASGGRHIFVFAHTPFYTVGYKSRQEVPNTETRWTQMFTKYGVALVFSGHDHTYYRTDRGNVTYVVAAGMADEKYRLDRKAEALPGEIYMGDDPEGRGVIRRDAASGAEVVEKEHYFVVETLVQGPQVVCRAVSTSGKEWERFAPVSQREAAGVRR